MYKFMKREEWLKVINRWILDGSKLESFGDNPDGEWVVLSGKDGAREELYFFYDEATYNRFDEMQPYSESTQPRTARMIVEVSLDALPGGFHTPESAKSIVQALLWNTIGHYNPKVALSDNSESQDAASDSRRIPLSMGESVLLCTVAQHPNRTIEQLRILSRAINSSMLADMLDRLVRLDALRVDLDGGILRYFPGKKIEEFLNN